MDVDAPPSPAAAEPSPDATRPSPMDDDDSDDNSITLDQMREKARIRREASPEAPSMTPWTGDKQEQDLVKALVSTLLQTPESAPRGPTGFAVEAIKQLGFDPESKGQIRSFISKGDATPATNPLSCCARRRVIILHDKRCALHAIAATTSRTPTGHPENRDSVLRYQVTVQ